MVNPMSEEENITDKGPSARRSRTTIKPVNPNQVLLSIKKNVHSQQLVTEQTAADYRAEFGRLSTSVQMASTFGDWCNLYRRLTGWEIGPAETDDPACATYWSTRRTKPIRSSRSSSAATTTTGSTTARRDPP